MKKVVWKNTLALVSITLVAALLLAVIYQITKDPIAKAEQEERMASFYAVFPEAADFAAIDLDQLKAAAGISIEGIRTAYEAVDAAGGRLGVVVSAVSHNGYGGDLILSVGVKTDFSVSGVKVTGMNETSGLGSLCQDEAWLSQFSGKTAPKIGYVKDARPAEDEIDALTGATTTTKAVLEAVNSGITFVRAYLGGSKE